MSFANVGELALDVLITSLLPAGLSLVARVDEPNCLPVVGNDAYSLDQPGSLTTAMELFQLQGDDHGSKLSRMHRSMSFCKDAHCAPFLNSGHPACFCCNTRHLHILFATTGACNERTASSVCSKLGRMAAAARCQAGQRVCRSCDGDATDTDTV